MHVFCFINYFVFSPSVDSASVGGHGTLTVTSTVLDGVGQVLSTNVELTDSLAFRTYISSGDSE